MNTDHGVGERVSEASVSGGRDYFGLLASTEVADLTALSGEVQAIAHRFNSEFEAVLSMEAASGSSESGSAIVQRLLPTVVAVLEQLDEFYKDRAAYKAEVFQLREENANLIKELVKVKDARREAEDVGSLLHILTDIPLDALALRAFCFPLCYVYFIYFSFTLNNTKLFRLPNT